MAETNLQPLDPHWPTVGDWGLAKSGMETSGATSTVKTEEAGAEQWRQALVAVKTRMDTTKGEWTAPSSTEEKDEDAFNVPVKFEKLSEAEMNHQECDLVDPSEQTQNKGAPMPRHSSPQSAGRAARRMTRKPQFTQRVWRLDIVGGALDRWRRIGAAKGLRSDTQIASFLMQHYEDTLSGLQSAVQCSSCRSPLALTCIRCNPTNGRTLVPPRHITVLPHPRQADVSDRVDDEGDRVDDKSDMMDDEGDRMDGKGDSVDGNGDRVDGEGERVDDVDDRVEEPVMKDDQKKRKDFRVSVKLPQGRKRRKRKRKLQPVPRARLPKQQARPEPSRLPKPEDATTADRSASLKENNAPSDSAPQLSSAPRRHICGECGATFTRSGGLKVHMRIHTGEKPYKCEDCGMAFNQTVSLIVHKRKHSGERPYACTECGATFPLASTLKQHARIHSGERPFSCIDCHKTFSRSGDLTSHMRVHTGLKPFLCHDCGKRFASSSDLTKHKRTHTGDKPFECSECHKKFPFPHRLTAHMRSHTGDKPYLCTVCGAAFARASNLTVHFRIHTGDKPFECDECGKRFSDSGNLCKHRRTSHGGTGRKSDRAPSSEAPAIAGFPPGTDFPDLTLPSQLTLPQTVPATSLPAFAPNSALLAPQGVGLGSEDSGSAPVGCDSLPASYSSLSQAPSALSVANALMERGGAFPPAFDGDGSLVSGAKPAAAAVLGEEGRSGSLTLKCEDCPAGFADPGVLAKRSQGLHSSLDRSFIAVGSVEPHPSAAAVAFQDVRVGSSSSGGGGCGMGDEQASTLPYFSTAALSYYYQQ